jgi:putative tryptophan/tyrosine transport system substrate-binding protein
MKRRQFITLLGGAVASWPLAALGQQGERMRRIGVLMSTAADDAQSQLRLAAFLQGLQESGWADGRNVRIDIRWAAGEPELYRRYAAELVALAPDVILGAVTTSVRALLEVTRTIPIVFAAATDPVGGGLIASLARPGGNVTGFSVQEFGLRAKSLELLKELSPRIARVAVLRDSTTTGGVAQFASQLLRLKQAQNLKSRRRTFRARAGAPTPTQRCVLLYDANRKRSTADPPTGINMVIPSAERSMPTEPRRSPGRRV